MTAPVDVIQAFDAEIVRLWGEALTRGWPHPKDKVVAESWLLCSGSMACVGVSDVPRPFFHGRHENAWWVGRQGLVLSLWTKLRTTRRAASGGLSC